MEADVIVDARSGNVVRMTGNLLVFRRGTGVLFRALARRIS
jgi:hypothetical protein